MLTKPAVRDERGSALVSVLVMMLVLTLFALTLAAVVTNTSSTLAGGRSASQARAATDAGLAAGLAAFKSAKGVCPAVPITSTTAPVYSVTCTAGTDAVTFVSTGTADGGRQTSVQAVYGYTMAQSYEAKVGQLTFFSATTTMLQSNIVTSITPSPARVIVAVGDFWCTSAMAANVVVEGNFIARGSCAVSGWVKVQGNATLDSGSSVGGNLTAGGITTLGSGSSVGGTLTSGGNALVESNSSVVGDLATGGYADLASGTSVGGNLTSTGYSDIEGVVKGNVEAGSKVTTWSQSTVSGYVTAAGTARTDTYGKVGKYVTAAGPVTIHDKSVVSGNVIAAGSSTSEVGGTVGGDFSAAGEVVVQSTGNVTGNAVAAGTAATTVNGTIAGNLKVAGAVTITGTVSGDVTAAGTGITSLAGKVTGSLKVAGTVTMGTNAAVGADLINSGIGTDQIDGKISGNVNAGGKVDLYLGSVGGNLTLPDLKDLKPSDATVRVAGNVTSKPAPAAPAAPGAPTVSLTPPVVTVTPPSNPTIPTWQDYAYSSADWPGYAIRVLGNSECNERTWATTELEPLTKPTVIDATGCDSGLHQHPAEQTTVTISADIVVVATKIDLQNITFKAKSGVTPHLWFVVSSVKKNGHSGDISLISSNLDVPTLLYTPGVITFQSSRFTGSMYAEGITFSGTPGNITAAPVDFPIPLFDAAQPPTTGTFSVTRISQREVA